MCVYIYIYIHTHTHILHITSSEQAFHDSNLSAFRVAATTAGVLEQALLGFEANNNSCDYGLLVSHLRGPKMAHEIRLLI